MNILINKEQLISALAGFIPKREVFQIHDQGEYGEVIISLWNEDKESDEFFTDFLEHCKISQDEKSVKEMKERAEDYKRFDSKREKWFEENA